jgi:hypothetical protein
MNSTKSAPSVAEQERLLERTRADLRAELILQMKPNVPAWRKDLGEQFLMSPRADIKLRLKGLAYYKRLRCQ